MASNAAANPSVPIDSDGGRCSVLNESITEGHDQDADDDTAGGGHVLLPESVNHLRSVPVRRPNETAICNSSSTNRLEMCNSSIVLID